MRCMRHESLSLPTQQAAAFKSTDSFCEYLHADVFKINSSLIKCDLFYSSFWLTNDQPDLVLIWASTIRMFWVLLFFIFIFCSAVWLLKPLYITTNAKQFHATAF